MIRSIIIVLLLLLIGCRPSDESLYKVSQAKTYDELVSILGEPVNDIIIYQYNDGNTDIRAGWYYTGGRNIKCFCENGKIIRLDINGFTMTKAEKN